MNIYDLHHRWVERKKRKQEEKKKRMEEQITQEEEKSRKVLTQKEEQPSHNGKELKQLDFIKIFQILKKHILLYLITFPAAIIIAYLLVASEPRYYTCTVKMAPEFSSMSSSSISALASSFGVDLSSGGSSDNDAIIPELYPDLMQSVDFKTSMFDVPITTSDGKVKTTYYDYLHKYQKTPWWNNIFSKLFSKKKTVEADSAVNPFKLTKTQSDIANTIGGNITCSIDKKNYAISISVTDQDPLICATIVDTAKARLQDFITEYRTRKARKDLAYTQSLYNTAKATYEKTRRAYAAYSDANTDVTLPSVQSKLEDMENDMQLKYNTFTQYSQQLQQAKAKLIEQTPAFTTIQNATVPVKPAGPKRMIFSLIIGVIVIFIDSIYAFIKQ